MAMFLKPSQFMGKFNSYAYTASQSTWTQLIDTWQGEDTVFAPTENQNAQLILPWLQIVQNIKTDLHT